MSLVSATWLRLTPKRVACDATGLFVGSVSLLGRDSQDNWIPRSSFHLNPLLSKVYEFPVAVETKRAGLRLVALALNEGDTARAQVGALLLQLPDPPRETELDLAKAERRRLAFDLASSGMLKADADWDSKHPRTGTSPNAGGFATTGGAGDSSGGAQTSPRSDAGMPNVVALAPPAPSLFAETLSVEATEALAALATRLSVPTILFGALFIPSANAVVTQGVVPDRPDISYRWARDETDVTFSLQVDGEAETIQGSRGADNLVRDADGVVVARVVSGPDGRETLVADVDALEDAADDRHDAENPPSDDKSSESDEPKLCPDPTPEPKTTKSAMDWRSESAK